MHPVPCLHDACLHHLTDREGLLHIVQDNHRLVPTSRLRRRGYARTRAPASRETPPIAHTRITPPPTPLRVDDALPRPPRTYTFAAARGCGSLPRTAGGAAPRTLYIYFYAYLAVTFLFALPRFITAPPTRFLSGNSFINDAFSWRDMYRSNTRTRCVPDVAMPGGRHCVLRITYTHRQRGTHDAAAWTFIPCRAVRASAPDLPLLFTRLNAD